MIAQRGANLRRAEETLAMTPHTHRSDLRSLEPRPAEIAAENPDLDESWFDRRPAPTKRLPPPQALGDALADEWFQ